MELDLVILVDDETLEELGFKTNAPREVINGAIIYADNLAETLDSPATNIEYITEYILKEGYVFEEANLEKYYY